MNRNTKNLVLSAMFLALGQVLPFVTAQIPQIGSMLLPMHYPIFLCGFTCGGFYAAIVGIICPLLRSVLFGMPPMYPTAVAMAVELCAYGLVTGIVFKQLKNHSYMNILITLIIAMILGRIAWGVAQTLLLSSSGGQFTFAAFLAGGFVNALPGIIAQLILIPILVTMLVKVKVIR